MSDESGPDDETTRSEAVASGETVLSGDALEFDHILELDHVYEALGHQRRRYLCYTLREETEWSLSDLATKIAAWENDVPEHAVTESQRERVYVSLYHAHVPKLTDEGVVTFDQETERITAAENAEQVLAVLRRMGASSDADQETHARGEMDDSEE